MANSRLEKVGTIFNRITGLLRSGAMKMEDKPIWYDIYRAFPPKYEPFYARTVDLRPIPQIFYPEDKLRSLLHKKVQNLPADDLLNEDMTDITKRAINMAQDLMKNNLDMDEEQAINSVIKTLKNEGYFKKRISSRRPQTETIKKKEISSKSDDETLHFVSTDAVNVKDILDQNVNVTDIIDQNRFNTEDKTIQTNDNDNIDEKNSSDSK